ncbi:MAG: ribonucleotide reductase subunit alpha [Phenylobacterium sp.]|uniref:ribonucleotide reductase subunit alpha n=1 Tax=Phenylobacterium sp. TaxID=1871053 RepID=UPI0011F58AC2|nr:ribonucleotide reductase subunit alpha [Phenylobacterium sp.]TAJ70295.1 MAG: ribonucleotide reductase subunit alpha [Phenylobacterium sp.]
MTQGSHFQQLLRAAADQPEPQRLLFVFAGAGLPDHPTDQQRARFLAGAGGALTPLMCVDKAPADVADFDALVADSRRAGPPWQVMFAAGLSGFDGRPPTQSQIDPALEKMVNAVRLGAVGAFAAYDASGDPIQIR